MRKILGCGFLTLIMIFALSAPTTVHGATKFSDTAGHWAEDYINKAVTKGIINGYPDGTFLPDKPITRAEFTTIINKALGNNGTTTISFKDVPKAEWYYNEVSKAVAASYVAGYEDNTFKPNSSITRQEAAIMISRVVPTYGYNGNLKVFLDENKVDSWAYSAMQKVNGKKYMGGYDDGKLHPTASLTRSQTAKIICDIIDNETIVKTTTIVKNDGTKLSGRIYSNGVTIHEDLGDGSASIENSVVLGTLNIEGGDVDTITINNSRVANAVVDKKDSSVRVLARGETSISSLTAHRDSILQTSSLAGGFYGPGFNNIIVRASANVTLKGSFPDVSIEGTRANVRLESGSISELGVTSAGKLSDITIDSGTSINNATVNAESYFHGTGTIYHMAVNADNITYETKPRNWTIARGAETPEQMDPSLAITMDPKDRATNVYRDTKITLTFSSAMTEYDGSSITNAEIEDFITLRKGSSSGTRIPFSATINSARKIITITLDNTLDASTRYYVILDKNSMKDTYGNGNPAQTFYFTTGQNTSALTTTFSPADKAASVPVMPTITISFTDSVVRYSNGASISTSDSYLKECIVFKEGSSSGKNVSYTASIDTAKKKITIKPSSNLTLNKVYYVGVLGNKLKTSGGVTVPAKSVTWTTGHVAPSISNFTVAPGDTSITATMTPNVDGKLYAVVLAEGSAKPSAQQIAAGQNSAGGTASASAKNESVKAGTSVTLPNMTGLASGVKYDVWATLLSGASSQYSDPIKVTTTTTLPKIYLSGLTVGAVEGETLSNYDIKFNQTTDTYNVSIPSNISKVRVAATASEDATITINGEVLTSKDFTVTENTVVKVVISKAQRTTTTYTINLNVTKDTGIESLKIGGAEVSRVSGDTSFSYALNTSDSISMRLDIVAKDPYAMIDDLGSSNITITEIKNTPGSASYNLDIASGQDLTVVNFRIYSGDQNQSYFINFTKPASSPAGESEELGDS
jgi:hypothetical protein